MRLLDGRLFEAVRVGDLAAAAAAVADGASVRAQGDDGAEEPLHLACFKGHLDIAQWLHSAGALVDATNSDGQTPLQSTCCEGHIARWLHGASASYDATDTRPAIDASDRHNGWTMHLACSKGQLGIAQWLHSVGASVNATDSDGDTPFHDTCREGHLDFAQWLHSVGTTVDATNSEGQTPLHLACMIGNLEIAQWLCSAGADATLKTNGGSTPAQLLQRPDRTVQLDQQELRSTLACLVRQAQAQGPLPCPAATVQARKADAACHSL